MADFLNKFFGNRTEKPTLDELKAQVALSFRLSQLDMNLISLCVMKLEEEPSNSTLLQSFLKYQQLAVKTQEIVSIVDELHFLENFVALYQQVLPSNVEVLWTQKIEHQALQVPRFILVPLVQNALLSGYNTVEKYPMKIKISVFEKAISLDITNHVNHHIDDQANTELIGYFKARLGFEFADRHTLIMNSNAHTFRSNLLLKF